MSQQEELDLTPELLLHAYASGIFPMAESHDDPELFWVDPRQRGIFPLEGFHLSRSLIKRMKKGGYAPVINHDFSGIVTACADRDETWINPTLFDLYAQLHAMGYAHSFEIRGENTLWGAVFGITLGGAFFGESMVSLQTDGSKLALAHLCDHLKRAGFSLFDTQFITPHLASLGAIEIPRADYQRRLHEALTRTGKFVQTPVDSDVYSVIQRSTQTS
ncbi:leucyl/phenylalanyl-tRNA--protein transferase [Alisedimentitalea sp. MJ-SS2]|uniref:leucyl/phenylalanyl-tRNA--protein transferase n=1 Tax=Aliisedimentitalea sp. MJ-SS2 TaxID=3049795 RepID=UPI00290C1E6C|nr:leucyl/phenylalanyl-tRNA--protein transferase [Alisedimentitalea sp. MJ-SS2]MDU8929084.1 leucyl/phenylalanyl-tRNA--protein transferase [Alisedimentitalea sp. MJ-SS2]